MVMATRETLKNVNGVGRVQQPAHKSAHKVLMHARGEGEGQKVCLGLDLPSAVKRAGVPLLAQRSMARSMSGQRWHVCRPGVFGTCGRNVHTKVWAELQSDDFRSQPNQHAE